MAALTAATWTVVIQNASVSALQEMIRQWKESIREGYSSGSRDIEGQKALPMLRTLRECFPSHLRDRATKLLGIEFGAGIGTCFMDMTPLGLSILMVAVQPSEIQSRVRIVESLLAVGHFV